MLKIYNIFLYFLIFIIADISSWPASTARGGSRSSSRSHSYRSRSHYYHRPYYRRPFNSNPTKNKKTPFEVKAGSNEKAFWQCLKNSEHFWEATIRSITKGGKCPICLNRVTINSNSLATTDPELAKQWHPTKNNLTPYNVTRGYTKKVWWLCSKSHEWQAAVCDRAKKKSGCPYCSGNKKII